MLLRVEPCIASGPAVQLSEDCCIAELLSEQRQA